MPQNFDSCSDRTLMWRMNSLSFGCSTGGITLVSGMVTISLVAGLKRTFIGSEMMLPGSARQFCPAPRAAGSFTVWPVESL